ncbi:MAG TPA: hypothetical protein VER03_09060 [Bryobacteraceae bacterium]|nr:hypothetical protein [Bryobacteraceae bacterium]
MVLTLGQLTTARHALLGAKNAAEAVAAAIRTVRDLGNSGRNGDVALRDANQSGWVNGHRWLYRVERWRRLAAGLTACRLLERVCLKKSTYWSVWMKLAGRFAKPASKVRI